MKDNKEDLTKLCKLLLLMLHKISTSTNNSRGELIAESGYLLRDLGWPCDVVEELDYDKYKWNDRLDLRGFDK